MRGPSLISTSNVVDQPGQISTLEQCGLSVELFE